MDFLDLPVELLLRIVGELDDIFEFIRLARVCKRLQSLVKSMVLVVSDNYKPSNLFRSISDNHIYLQLSSVLNKETEWKKVFEKYHYLIFEYSGVELGELLTHYICQIADLKTSPSQKIDVVILNQTAAELSKTIVFDPRSFIPEKLGQVSKTIFAYDSDVALNAKIPDEITHETEALMLMGNTYYFKNVERLPQLYIYANQRYQFKIVSPNLKAVSGITNVNDRLPRLPTLFNFLHNSRIPNLEALTGIGIESGMDLRVFERFEKLNKLHLDSVFTGNLALNVAETRMVSLLNLNTFKISGNSISISDLFLPKLQTFDITITGSTERNFRSTIHMENIQTPRLKELYISASNIPDAPSYILNHLDIKTITVMCIYSSNYSTFPKLEQLYFPKLEEIKLGAFNVTSDEFVPVPFKINAPKLKLFNVKNLQNYNQVLFNRNMPYPGLRSLYLHLKVLPEPQVYEFTKENFADLEILDIGYFNKFGRLVANNINLSLDLPKLKRLVTKKAILDKIQSTTDLTNGSIDLQIVTTPGMST